MDSETDEQVNDCVKASPRKRNPGKIPRKIHKAAREKLKRDRMNELFMNLARELGTISDVDHMNNGKASILREAIRLVGELLTQAESLKKENLTLLSESDYVTAERHELQEETSMLATQVERLHKEIAERSNSGNLGVSGDFAAKLTGDRAHISVVGCAADSGPHVGPPLFVLPLAPNAQQGYSVPFPEVNVPTVPSSVSKPQPRYPSSSDSWPSRILAEPDECG